MVDVKKYEGFYKQFMDELEMANYLTIIKESHKIGIISEEEYKDKLNKLIKSYESK